jgi:hypothetical protein
MWGALLARALIPFGVLVIIPDYRNFPQTHIDGMIQDVDESIQWTFDNCRKLGISCFTSKILHARALYLPLFTSCDFAQLDISLLICT